MSLEIFFNSWESVLRVLVTAIITYPLLILALRLGGKRSLSKLNMFDFVVTVAIGSTFGAVIIYESISLFDGIVTISILLLGQGLISYLAIKFNWLERLIQPKPTLIFLDGNFLEENMTFSRVARAEVLAEMRGAGYVCADDVYAVVLETNGVLSVLGRKTDITNSTLIDIPDYPDDN